MMTPNTPSTTPTEPTEEWTRARIKKLRTAINAHNHAYFQLNAPTISDEAYDKQLRELKTLEKKHTNLASPTSPTQTLGYTPVPTAQTQTFTHPLPMLSLENALDIDEAKEFFKKREKDLNKNIDAYCLSPKYDGLAVELLYIQNKLTLASTRGDGHTGEVVTHNAHFIESIPKILTRTKNLQKHLPQPPLPLFATTAPPIVLVRGEVVMLKSHFQALNTQLETDYKQKLADYHKKLSACTPTSTEKSPKLTPPTLKQFSNPRNAAAGSLRQLKIAPPRLKKLAFFAYELFLAFPPFEIDEFPQPATANPALPPTFTQAEVHKLAKLLKKVTFTPLASHYTAFEVLAQLGFNHDNPHKDFSANPSSFAEVSNYYHKMEALRATLDFVTDGIVVELAPQDLRLLLGVVGKRPRYALAWKFPPEIKETTLENVLFQVGRSGVVSPVGMVKPVTLSGAEVKRVTLHNKAEINRLGIKINDTVQITRSGDVIPKILTVNSQQRSGNELPIVYPEKCPSCQTLLVESTTDIQVFCPNPQCPAQILKAICHFVSKSAMNIDGISERIIEELLERDLIRELPDLYTLSKANLFQLERMGPVLAEKLLKAIAQSKQTTLTRFIYALGISNVGERTAQTLAQFISLEKLISGNNQAELVANLAALNDLGEITAQNITQFFYHPHNRRIIKKLLALGVSPHPPPPPSTNLPLSGKKIVFTGTLQALPRRIAKEKAIALGADIAPTLSANIDYLIAGENAGSKLKKAQEFNVPTLSENDFLNLIRQ